MKYIITENQLKVLINEQQNQQQGIIKLNLEKDEDNTKLKNYCKPVLIDKKIINKHIVKVDSELNEWLADFKKDYEKQYPEISKYLLDIEKILSQIKPIMSSSHKNVIYTKFGYLNYNDKDDLNKAFKIIYDSLNKALTANLAKKILIKTFITKKNVGMVKEGVDEFFKEFYKVVYRLRRFIPLTIENDIKEDYEKIATKCTNLLVTRNQYGNKVQPYNPTHPPLVKSDSDINSVNLDTILNPYILLVKKTIDSFV